MVFFDETSYLIIELFVEKYLPSKIVPTSLFVRPNYQPVGLDLVHLDYVNDHISLNCGTLMIDFLVEKYT